MKRSSGKRLPDWIRVVTVDPTTAAEQKNTALVGHQKALSRGGTRAAAKGSKTDYGTVGLTQGGEGVKDSQAGRNKAVGNESSDTGTRPAENQVIEFEDVPEPGFSGLRRVAMGRTELVTEAQLKLLMVGGVLTILVLAEIFFFVASVILSVRTGNVDGLQQFYSQIFNLLVPILVGVGGYFFGRHMGKRK